MLNFMLFNPPTMSQNSSDRHSPPRPKPHLPQATASQPGQRRPLANSLDENADRLMDQVFGDIERLLERGAQLQLESPPAPESSPPHSHSDSHGLDSETGTPPTTAADLTSSSLALLPKLSPRQLTREAMATDPDDDDTDLLLELSQAEKPQPEESQFLSKLLLTIAFASLVITSGIWFFVRYSLPQVAATANVPSATDILQARRDAEFLDYVQRAMERIDRASQQAEASAPTETGSLPSALSPLYVPLSPPPTVATLPTAPSPTARISVSPLPPVAAIPLAPTAAAPAPSPSTAAVIPTTVIPNIAPSPTHVLIGLLELGDRSAALFEIAGAPQRVQVGESIGSSGWALVSVSGEEAIVRRNGEVRSVYIGQKF